MSSKYQVSTHGQNGRYAVINTELPRDDESRIIVTCDREVRAKLIVDELNKLQDQIEKKPLTLQEDFQEWKTCMERVNIATRRLVEIEEIHLLESQRIISEAQAYNVDFKALYGGNTVATRQQYADEQLTELLEEKKELTFQKDEDNRKISYLKRLIDMKIELIKYE